MSKRKLQERKNRKKKERAKQRVERRRKKVRQDQKQAKETAKMSERYRIKQAPFRKDQSVDFDESVEETTEEVKLKSSGESLSQEPPMTEQTNVEDARKVEWIKQKLEHNMKILEALEAEIEKEEQERKDLMEDLEDKGAKTLREKIDLIGKEAEKKAAQGRFELKI